MRDHSTVIHHYKTAKGVERELPPLDPDSPFGGVLAPFEQRAWELVIQGYSHEQIGGILGITGKTSRGYTSSARRKLRMYATVERDIVEDLLLWAPLVSLSLESHAGNILYRAAEEIKMLRGKHEN